THDLVGHHLHLFVDLVEAPAHEALDRVHGVLGIRHGLALGDLADEALAGLREGHDRRGDAPALGVRDDLGASALQDGHAAIRGPQVDADDLAHFQPPAFGSRPTSRAGATREANLEL